MQTCKECGYKSNTDEVCPQCGETIFVQKG